MLPSANRGPSRTPEAWFRIVYTTPPHGKYSEDEYRLSVEVALGPWGAFESGNIGRFERTVTAKDLVSAVALRKCMIPRPSRPPKPPKVVATLQKAAEWRRQLDAGEIASQTAIARREGLTRARVTQILMLLRLAPDIQKAILGVADNPNPPRLPEKSLRPITRIQDPDQQAAAFADVIDRSS